MVGLRHAMLCSWKLRAWKRSKVVAATGENKDIILCCLKCSFMFLMRLYDPLWSSVYVNGCRCYLLFTLWDSWIDRHEVNQIGSITEAIDAANMWESSMGDHGDNVPGASRPWYIQIGSAQVDAKWLGCHGLPSLRRDWGRSGSDLTGLRE